MAVTSMTGFARADGRIEGPPAIAWAWEVRSVNGRGLDIRLRLPSGFDQMEAAAKALVAEHAARGNVTVGLSVVQTESAARLKVDEALLNQLINLVAGLQDRLPPGIAPARLDGLLAVKGVLVPEGPSEAQEPDPDRDGAVLNSLRQALKAFAEARAGEGRQLGQVLSTHLDQIGELVGRAAQAADARLDATRYRLRTQVRELLEAGASLVEDRLAQELAILAVKSDVREELERLRAHVHTARELLSADGPSGRRLDFLCQELNREANTLCSKSGDMELTRIGLDLKVVIDQFREQVQNVE